MAEEVEIAEQFQSRMEYELRYPMDAKNSYNRFLLRTIAELREKMGEFASFNQSIPKDNPWSYKERAELAEQKLKQAQEAIRRMHRYKGLMSDEVNNLPAVIEALKENPNSTDPRED